MRGLMGLGGLLLILWIMAWLVLKVTGFFIHVLLIAGVVMLIMGFIRRAT